MKIFLAGDMRHVLPILEALDKAHHKVTVMIADRGECEELADLTGHVVIHGDATRREAQAEAHIRHFDLVVALTARDADNLMICDIAKRHFGVRRSLAAVESPALEVMFERLGVDEAESFDDIAARLAAGFALA